MVHYTLHECIIAGYVEGSQHCWSPQSDQASTSSILQSWQLVQHSIELQSSSSAAWSFSYPEPDTSQLRPSMKLTEYPGSTSTTRWQLKVWLFIWHMMSTAQLVL